MTPISYTEPYWWTRPWRTGEVRVRTVGGLDYHPMNPMDTSEDGSVQVDASIAMLVIKLNAIGCRTSFCCSGLRADHRGETEDVTGPTNGYILFAAPMPLSAMGPWLTEPLSIDGDSCLRAQPYATDEGLAEAWRVMEERLDAAVAAHAASELDTPAQPT